MVSTGPDVIALGEILVEVMRTKKDVPHTQVGEYSGPYPSGAPAIFIDAVARLGAKCGFIGIVGDDDFGKLLIDRLRKDGVETGYIKVKKGFTTGTTFVMYYSSGSRKFIFHLRHTAAGQLSPTDLDPRYISKAKLLHVMGSSLAVSESSREACYEAVRIVKKAGGMVTFDPNLRPELLSVGEIQKLCAPIIRVCDVVLPSGTEAEALTGVKDSVEAAKVLLKAGPRIAVIKLGGRGSIIATKDEIMTESAFDVVELDPTGAGDVYDGAFVVGMLEGWPLKRTARFASAAGAIKVMKFGPMEGPESRREVEEFASESAQKDR